MTISKVEGQQRILLTFYFNNTIVPTQTNKNAYYLCIECDEAAGSSLINLIIGFRFTLNIFFKNIITFFYIYNA